MTWNPRSVASTLKLAGPSPNQGFACSGHPRLIRTLPDILQKTDPMGLRWLTPNLTLLSLYNAEVTGAGAQRREPKAVRFWRPVDRLVNGRSPAWLSLTPRPHALSRTACTNSTDGEKNQNAKKPPTRLPFETDDPTTGARHEYQHRWPLWQPNQTANFPALAITRVNERCNQTRCQGLCTAPAKNLQMPGH